MSTFCSYYNESVCKSCDLITADYITQLHHKENIIKESLGSLLSINLLPTVQSPLQKFRNKAKLVVTGNMDNPVLGLWGENNLDEGRELLNCPLHVEPLNKALPVIKEFIKLAKLYPYNIALKKGELKGVILFHSEATEEMYLRFVLRSKEPLDRIKKHSTFLKENLSHLKCLSANIQPIPHAVLEGEEEVFLTEQNYIHHKAGNVSIDLGPQAFVQTNQSVASELYKTASIWIKDAGTKKFMELFCGQGAFSFFASESIEEGLGIEINPEAVKTANQTAKKHKLNHLSFKSADASEVLSEIKEFRPDLVLVNPPRRGLAGAVQIFLEALPEKIIYSSCNYKTLASDIEKLSHHYKISRIQIFDMFPHTGHFETLVELYKF